MKKTFADHTRQLVAEVGDQMLPLSVMLGSMVYMLACYIDIGSVCAHHYIVPKLIFCLSMFNFAVIAIRESSKLCFGLAFLGLPGALVVIQTGMGMVGDIGPSELGLLEVMDIGAAMIVTLPFVLLAGSLGISIWRALMNFVGSAGVFGKSTR